MALSRRNFMFLAGLTGLDLLAELGGKGIVTSLYKAAEAHHRKPTYVSPAELEQILGEAGVKPLTNTSDGNRTLLVISDFHLGLGGSHVELLKNLSKRIDIEILSSFRDMTSPDIFNKF